MKLAKDKVSFKIRLIAFQASDWADTLNPCLRPGGNGYIFSANLERIQSEKNAVNEKMVPLSS